jgi:tetratricopeptide (TPR) repeat protein
MAAGAWAEAADVYARALALFPEQSLLKQNVAYLAQEWNKAAYKAGGASEAAKVTKTLKEKFPSIEFAAKGGANELKRTVNDLMRAGKHAEALKALEDGKELLADEKDPDHLWVAVYDDQARTAIQAGKWADAADVYAAALVRLPKNGHIENNVGYLAQEWAKAMSAKGDHAAAAEALRLLKAKFPDSKGVAGSAENHVHRTVRELGAKKPEEALALLDSWKDLLPGPDDLQEAAAPVYDQWAEALADAKSWQEAVDVYAKALERFPKSGHLKNNAVATWYQWAKSFSDAKKWDEAIAIYDKALARMPDEGLFKQNKAWCEGQKKKG